MTLDPQTPGTFEIYEGRRAPFQRKQWRWRIRAANGRIVATGAEGYANPADLENGVRIARAVLSGRVTS